jgi:hypothetical protein
MEGKTPLGWILMAAQSKWTIVAARWLLFALLVLACARTTYFTMNYRGAARIIDDFTQVLDWQTGEWRGGALNMADPLHFHKEWNGRHAIRRIGMTLMTLSWVLLSVYLMTRVPARSMPKSWWVFLAVLVVACIFTTIAAAHLHSGGWRLLDDFSTAIDWETRNWRGEQNTPHLRAPIYFHKQWTVQVGLTSLGIKYMACSWAALCLFLAASTAAAHVRALHEARTLLTAFKGP